MDETSALTERDGEDRSGADLREDTEAWSTGEPYERFVGRWSRRVAAAFVEELAVPPGRQWLDVGCGTGALTTAIVEAADPRRVVGLDPSEGFLATARAQTSGPVSFHAADARALPVADGCFDAVVSGLALNFVPGPLRAATEFARVAKRGAVVAAYVWDYAGGMGMLRLFWEAAAALDPAAADLDEGRRFPLCQPESLRLLWTDAGLSEVTVRPIDILTVFTDFEDYWQPFLGGQGPAPGYVASLTEKPRQALRDLLRARLPGGAISLTARAWAVRGKNFRTEPGE